MLPKSSWETFKTIFETLSALGACHVTINGGWYIRNQWFSRFLEYISKSFWYFFMKSFLVVKILPSSCDKHQNVDYGCSSYPGRERGSKSQFWPFFDNFGNEQEKKESLKKIFFLIYRGAFFCKMATFGSILVKKIINDPDSWLWLILGYPNEYLWSYMIETDMPLCVLTCFRVNWDL